MTGCIETSEETGQIVVWTGMLDVLTMVEFFLISVL